MSANYYNCYHLKHFAATVAACMELPLPDNYAPAIDWAADVLKERLGGPADRVVLYHADSVPMYVWQQYPYLIAPIYRYVSVTVPFVSTIIPCTPPAHASMYTGMTTYGHGIFGYWRPQLTCDTLYDRLVEAGKKAAIVAMTDSTFLHIFAGRDIEYYECETTDEIEATTKKLIESDEYDFISVHTFAYENAAHAHGPESEQALHALEVEAKGFANIAEAMKPFSEKHRILLSYSPDHGHHLVPRGVGEHCLVIPEDMNVLHFFGTM